VLRIITPLSKSKMPRHTCGYAGLFEKDQAFRSLERAYSAHDVQLQHLNADPHFDSPALRLALRRSHKTLEILPVTCLALLVFKNDDES